MKKILAVLVVLVLGVSVASAAEYSRTGNWVAKTSYAGLDYTEEDFLREASEIEEFDLEAYKTAVANNELYTVVADVRGSGIYAIFGSECVTVASFECDNFSVSLRELIRTGAFQKAVDLGNNLYYLVNWDGTAGYYFVF